MRDIRMCMATCSKKLAVATANGINGRHSVRQVGNSKPARERMSTQYYSTRSNRRGHRMLLFHLTLKESPEATNKYQPMSGNGYTRACRKVSPIVRSTPNSHRRGTTRNGGTKTVSTGGARPMSGRPRPCQCSSAGRETDRGPPGLGGRNSTVVASRSPSDWSRCREGRPRSREAASRRTHPDP